VGNRLSRIYTRTGDDGTTGLADGSRLAKDSPRVASMGDLDELNANLGVVLANPLPDAIRETLIDAQHALFDIGAELAMPGAGIIDEARVEALEAALDALNAGLPPLKEFILPGGGVGAGAAHVARAVCRRAERGLVALACDEPVNEPVNEASRRYVNRLSDYLFVAARILARAGSGEVYWKHERSRGSPA
jgi:cob(I)alamin adenosyltransferase